MSFELGSASGVSVALHSANRYLSGLAESSLGTNYGAESWTYAEVATSLSAAKAMLPII